MKKKKKRSGEEKEGEELQKKLEELMPDRRGKGVDEVRMRSMVGMGTPRPI